MKKSFGNARRTTLAALACGASITGLLAAPAYAQDGEQLADGDDVIVVTGFRASLNKALDAKQDSTAQIDVIVAEDIAKFPDQNLAESLQRIPGVAIERDAGEGRSITVRGLGSQFTRVRVNGMETISTSTNGASANRDRAFDFNVFASELFSSIVVHKTAEASLDEGSLGAVVDLNTGNALAYDPGFTLVASAQARYNDLNEQLSPRLAGLVGWTNADQTFGVSASVAFSDYNTAELGNNTVRWAAARFRSVGGVNCAANPTDTGCMEVTNAFHPRIPRYGLISHDRQRLGATGSIQFKPADSTLISIDGLYSRFKEDRDEYWGEVLLRNNEGNIDVTSYTLDGNNNIIAANLDNVYVRTERYHRESQTEFYQLSSRIEHGFSDNFRAILSGGISRSDADIPVETTLLFDDRDATGYSYDYTNMASPVLTFGPGITDPTAFEFAEFRDRPSFLTNKFKTAKLDLEWEPIERLSFKAGAAYRRFDFGTEGFRRDTGYCARFTCAPGTNGAPVTAAIAEIFNLGNAGQPAGNTNSWIVPNLAAGVDFIDLYNQPATFREAEKRDVTEEVKTAYFETNFDIDVLGMRTTGNFGVRYAKTDQSSSGFIQGQYVTVERNYDDLLPAININFFPMDNLILRAAIAKVITRPTLGTLTPGGGISEFGDFRITSGNPFIEPFRATNYDLSLEYYFAPGALASVALFKKDVETFPVGDSVTGVFADSGLPTSVLQNGSPLYCALVQDNNICTPGDFNPNTPIEFRTTINGEGASLKGIELGLSLPFSVFSDALSSFGIIGNLTFVDSEADFSIGGTVYTRPLLGVSKRSANGTVYYDDGKFSVRVSGAYRSAYDTATSGNGNIFEGFSSSFNVDAAIRYQLTDQIEISLDGNNLTDDYRFRYTDFQANRNYENNHYGRTIVAGVRFRM